jgi:hypothetical protein
MVLMKTCRTCLLSGAVSGADIDDSGICGKCREYSRVDHGLEEQSRKEREVDLEAALQACRGRGKYDCLVNLSGGKDSCYLLYKLKREYGLNVLAFTTDMNIPEIAWDNMKRTIAKLGIDHIVHTPARDFYRKLYRYLLQNQEARGAVRTVCYVCAPLFEGYALALAVEKNIPLVLAGYSPGQPEPDRMTYEFSRAMLTETDWTPPEVRLSGLFTEEELRLFWNPSRYPPGTCFPRYLAPFHAWPYNQGEVMKKVVELGLITDSRHASPVHSNCPLNWLLMYSDLKNLHYNPYVPEFSQLIREGKASRAQWRIQMPVVNAMIKTKTFMGRNVKTSLEWLDLKVEDLKITRPAPSPAETPGAPREHIAHREASGDAGSDPD